MKVLIRDFSKFGLINRTLIVRSITVDSISEVVFSKGYKHLKVRRKEDVKR